MLESLRGSDEQTAMQRRTASSKFVLNAFREIVKKNVCHHHCHNDMTERV